MVDISYNKTNLIACHSFYQLRFQSPALSLSLAGTVGAVRNPLANELRPP